MKINIRKLLITWGKVLCAATIVVCLLWLVMVLLDEKKVDNLNKEMQDMFENSVQVTVSAASTTALPTAQATSVPTTAAPTERVTEMPSPVVEATAVTKNTKFQKNKDNAENTAMPTAAFTATATAVSTEIPIVMPTVLSEATLKPMELPTAAPTPTVTSIPPQPENDERFASLYARNSDIVAWLWIGEDVSLPVVQRDNEYYLTHDFDGNHRDAGTLFMDENNEIWPRDDNLIIYGHNMNNDTMFGKLDQYRHVWYLQENPIIELQLIYESEPSKYAICAIFSCSVEEGTEDYFPVRQYIFSNSSAKLKYLQEIKERSLIQIDIDVGADDDLVTLVTCSYYEDDGRMLITARKLRDGETEQDIASIMQTAERLR